MPTTCNSQSIIPLLHHVIGGEATRCLTMRSAFGGRNLAVPKGEVGRGDKAFAALSEVIGMNAAQRLCNHFGGEVLYIPAGMKEILRDRDRRIVTAYSSGLTVNQLVAQFNLTARRIWQILKQTDMTVISTHENAQP
jgi:Mor family transcriptional regulator